MLILCCHYYSLYHFLVVPQDETPIRSPPPPTQDETPIRSPPPPTQDETPIRSPPPPTQDETPIRSPPPPTQDETPRSPPPPARGPMSGQTQKQPVADVQVYSNEN